MISRRLGTCQFTETWENMVEFTRARAADTPDELWLLEHPPVFTLGTSCKLAPSAILDGVETINTDRGGQITYHGPGQLVAYFLLDIKRLGSGPKSIVNLLEEIVIHFLAEFDVAGGRRQGAPGVYVDDKKIAALGLRISRGCSYHGLSINIDMDLTPYDSIDACGYPDLEVTQLVELAPGTSMAKAVNSFESIALNIINNQQYIAIT